MELVMNDPMLVVVQAGLGAAAVATPWVPLITGAYVFTTLIFAYLNDQARKEDEDKRNREDKWREKQNSEQQKVLQEENYRMSQEFQEREQKMLEEFGRIRTEDQERRIQDGQRQDAAFAEQKRLWQKEFTEKHTRSANQEIRFKKMIEEYHSKFLKEIGEKLEKDQNKRAEEEERRIKLFAEMERLATEKQNSLVTKNIEQQRHMESSFMEQQMHLATILKTSDVRTKVIELGDLIDFYMDFAQRYASDTRKMIAETEKYQRDLGIQLKRVSNALVEGEADVRLLNIWVNGVAHHIDILRHLGSEGLESLESVRAAVEIYWDTWKSLVSRFNNSLTATDDHVSEIERYFEEMYHKQDFLFGTLDPLIGEKLKDEL